MKLEISLELADAEDMLAVIHRQAAIFKRGAPKWIADKSITAVEAQHVELTLARLAVLFEGIRHLFPSRTEIFQHPELENAASAIPLLPPPIAPPRAVPANIQPTLFPSPARRPG